MKRGLFLMQKVKMVQKNINIVIGSTLIVLFGTIVFYKVSKSLKTTPYTFRPTLKAQRNPKKVMLITKNNILNIKRIANHLENKYALKVGSFIAKTTDHFFISNNPQMHSYRPLSQSECESHFDGKVIFDTLATKKLNYVQEIDSPDLLNQIQQDRSIREKTALKIGSFVVGCYFDTDCTKYVISKETLKNKYTVSPLRQVKMFYKSSEKSSVFFDFKKHFRVNNVRFFFLF